MRSATLLIRSALFLACVHIPVACSTNRAAARAAPDTPQDTRIDSIFAPFARTDSPGCAVGVYRAGEVLFAKGYGMASIEHASPISPRTPFNVASVSKQFTGFAIQMLAREGKLSLDDDIRRHLPDFPNVGATVTVRHLLHHMSGLRAYESLLQLSGWNRDHPLSREQALDIIYRHRTTGFPPGERYQYGNTNYVLLAEIVQRASGLPLDRFLAEKVFAPLGMKHTQLRTDPLAVIPGRAETYWKREGGGFRRNHVWAFAHATGPSNIITTVEDLARWDTEFYNERIGGRGMVQAMYQHARLNAGDTNQYASGIANGVHRGLPMVSHSGGAGGDYVLLRFPNQRITTVVLCNFEGGDAFGRSLQVAELFLGDRLAAEPVKPTLTPIAIAESALVRFTGEYRHPTNPEYRLRIDVQNGVLGAVVENVFHPAVTVGPRAFRDNAVSFEFSEPRAGTPTQLTFEGPGLRGTLTQWLQPPWRPAPAEFAPFVGTFRSEELDVAWTFVVRDNQLVLKRPRFTDRVLTPTDRDAFRFKDPFEDEVLDIDLTFVRNAAGGPNRFLVNMTRADNLEFNRVENR